MLFRSAEYLRRLATEANGHFQELKAAHPGKPCEALRAWLGEMADHIANGDDRGCALTNAAVELPEKEHPARCVIEEHKNAQRDQLIELCREAKLAALEELTRTKGLTPSETLAVGDGANDLAMIKEAGLGVAFHAKPAVAAVAAARVDHCDLTALLFAQGYRRAEFTPP